MQKRVGVSTWIARAIVLVAAALVVRTLREPYLTLDVTPALEGQLGVRYWEVARTSFARGDGFPLWDRSQCGGWPFLGNPDTPVVSGLFAGLFGIHGDVMSRWMITIAFYLGLVGTYAWCRRGMLLGRVASFFAGALFVSSGFVAFELLIRSHFLPFALLPWVLLFARLGERDLRMAIAAGAVLALIVLEGGILLPFCITLVALALSELPRLLHKQGGWKRVGQTLGVAFASFLSLSAVKLVPTVVQLMRHPRKLHELDQMSWAQVATVLGENELVKALGGAYHRDEYRAYVGPLALGMAIAGAGAAIVLKPRRFEVPLLVVGGLAIARGVFGPAAPFVLLTKLPLFHQLSVPSRWLGLVDFAIALAAAVAVDEAIKAVKRPALVLVVVAAAALAVYDPLVAAHKTATLYAPEPFLPRPDPRPAPYQMIAGTDLGRRAEYPGRNVGVANCYKLGLDVPEANGFWVGPLPQAMVNEGKVSASVRQDSYELDADLRTPAVVRINQTWDPDFRASLGEVRRGKTGLLEVALPQGPSHVTVRYRPAGSVFGLTTTIVGTLGALAALVWITRKNKLKTA